LPAICFLRRDAAIILALAVMAVGAATAQVLENTTGKRMDIAPGYTFVSNVAGAKRPFVAARTTLSCLRIIVVPQWTTSVLWYNQD
jgi:hypothetical protein